MKDKILCVDDDVSILQSQKRLLRKYFEVMTAEGGAQALEVMKRHGPFSVVISDMNMPGMNGIDFLAQSRKICADTTRIMLTGDSDLKTAEDAVNEGNIFRFLRKPCPPDQIAKSIKAAITQYHLVVAEKEVLEETLNKTIGVLIDILEIAKPQAFARTARVKKYMTQILQLLDIELENAWQYEMAPMLFPLGCIAIPEEILLKYYAGKCLSEAETELCLTHPLVAFEQLTKIPRMEEMANIIKYQNKNFDGSGFPEDRIAGNDIPWVARVLKAVIDYDGYQMQKMEPYEALQRMKAQRERYDPEILAIFDHVLDLRNEYRSTEVKVSDLRAGMVLVDNVETDKGVILATKGQELTAINAKRLFSFSLHSVIQEPITVLVGK